MRNSSSWGTSLPGSAAVGLAEDMFVETHLAGGLLGVVVGADPELKEAHVVCRQFNPDFDHLVDLVFANDDAVTKLAPCLVCSWLQILCTISLRLKFGPKNWQIILHAMRSIIKSHVMIMVHLKMPTEIPLLFELRPK